MPNDDGKNRTSQSGGDESSCTDATSSFQMAGRDVRSWAVLLTILVSGVAADLISKSIAFARVAGDPVVLNRDTILADTSWHPPFHEPVGFIPWILQFRLVLNRGAVFGIGPDHRWFFVGFTLMAMVAALSIFAFRTGRRQVVVHASLACILAGALGNLYDRIQYGAVRDFLNMFPEVKFPFGWTWPNGSPEIFPWVYNIADVLLLVGIGLLMVRTLFFGPRVIASSVETPEESSTPTKDSPRTSAKTAESP